MWKLNSPKEEPGDYYPETETKTEVRPMKWLYIGVGSIVGIAHIGVLGHLLHRPETPPVPQVPTINIPRGDYSSYTIEAGPQGYKIQYKANDPAILESHRSLAVDSDKKGLFGGGTEQRRESRYDQYTMDGTRNIGGGAIGESGKMNAQSVECIVADAGARSQGAMAGTAISAGVIVPAVANIPYVGWLASGWALLLGQKAGSELGSQVGGVFNDC